MLLITSSGDYGLLLGLGIHVWIGTFEGTSLCLHLTVRCWEHQEYYFDTLTHFIRAPDQASSQLISQLVDSQKSFLEDTQDPAAWCSELEYCVKRLVPCEDKTDYSWSYVFEIAFYIIARASPAKLFCCSARHLPGILAVHLRARKIICWRKLWGIVYTFQVRGLASPRDGARQGYATTLTELLRSVPQVTPQKVRSVFGLCFCVHFTSHVSIDNPSLF